MLILLKLLPKISITSGQVRIHKIPRLDVNYPHIFLRFKVARLIKCCRSDRPYFSKMLKLCRIDDCSRLYQILNYVK